MKKSLFRITDRIIFVCAVAILVSVISAASADAGLISSYSFEGSAVDSSGNGNNGTIYGGAAFVSGVSGQAIKLDGVDDYVRFSKSLFYKDNHAWTFSAWVQGSKNPGSANYIYSEGSHWFRPFLWIALDQMTVWSSDQNWGPGVGLLTNAQNLSDNRWRHIAVTDDNGNIKVYVDGALYASSNYTRDFNAYSQLSRAAIGAAVRNNEFGYFKGLIDEVNIYNTALTGQEIFNVYSSSFAQNASCLDNDLDGYNASAVGCGIADCNDNNGLVNPSASEVCGDRIDNNCDGRIDEYCAIAYYSFDGNAIDSSGNGNNGTIYGGAQFVQGVSGQALSFDGVDDYVKLSKSLYKDNPKMTVSAWVKAKPNQFSNHIYSEGNSNYYMPVFWMYIDPTNGGELWYRTVDSDWVTNAHVINSTQKNLSDNRWRHIAMTDDNGKVKVYINGVLDSSYYYSRSSKFVNMNQAAIGAAVRNSVFGYFYGAIDEVKIYNTALTGQEVLGIYNNVTIPCADNDLDGYNLSQIGCGVADCNDNDSLVNPAAIEVCGDSIDNDCGGLVDCGDGSCASDAVCQGVENPGYIEDNNTYMEWNFLKDPSDNLTGFGEYGIMNIGSETRTEFWWVTPDLLTLTVPIGWSYNYDSGTNLVKLVGNLGSGGGSITIPFTFNPTGKELGYGSLDYFGVDTAGRLDNIVVVKDVTVVPEPVSSTLFIVGGAALGGQFLRRRKEK